MIQPGIAKVAIPGAAVAMVATGSAAALPSHHVQLDPSIASSSLQLSRDTTISRIVAAADVPFLAFVLCLGVVVDAVMLQGLDTAMRDVLPTGDTLPALLGIAAVAAVLSNVVNNLPAVLVGVNIGPNLTYVGSLANLLWRNAVRREMRVGFAEFTRIGLCTVPLTLLAAVLGLWLGIRLFGV